MRGVALSEAELESTARLLFDVYGLEIFRGTEYLRWFYVNNPQGPAMVENRYTEGECVGHIAWVPQRYASGSSERSFLFAQNLAVSSKARMKGMMIQMAERCFERGRELLGGEGGLICMPNASSTRGAMGRLGFRLVRPLPAVVVPPAWPDARDVESHAVNASFLGSDHFACLAAGVKTGLSQSGFAQVWDPPLLRWRLQRPGARYALHVNDDLIVVTTTTHYLGLPLTVVLKTLPRTSREHVVANPLVAAACRFHRSVAAVYVGFSNAARVVGAHVPHRLKPAPLNLGYRSLDPALVDDEAFEFAAMELLDFDAY